MDGRPFGREGRALILSAVIGYAASLVVWLVVATYGRSEGLGGTYARGFALMVIPPLLLIPCALTLIVGILALRCHAFNNEMDLLRAAGSYAASLGTITAAALAAFFLLDVTSLYHQPHVVITAVFCLALAATNVYLVWTVSNSRVTPGVLHAYLDGAESQG